eukprot:gnl/Ergobibamus_cyprinoides/789.p1 GENE.gnl/Ergobibamus_cyprinoides/789~~gnl/Ergobibamus_cyprinoides/789.p1  ORF type:complete len:271 (+),score=49.42 gnl/Ergobibamus_cyprinoides/789:89-901(+)
MTPLLYTMPLAFCLRTLFKHLGRRLGRRLDFVPKSTEKLATAFYFGTEYLLLTILGVAAMIDCGVDFRDPMTSWRDFPFPLSAGSPLLRLHLYWELSHYVVGLLCLCFESRSQYKDFGMMLLHHFCTIVLLGMSIRWNIPVIGALTAMVHDVSDVFLEYSKVVNYTVGASAAQWSFIAFAVIFAFTRLYYYPYHLIYRTYLGAAAAGIVIPYRPFCLTFLLLLMPMHIHWFSLIVQMAVRLVRGRLTDIRDEEETTDGPEAHRRKNVKGQ